MDGRGEVPSPVEVSSETCPAERGVIPRAARRDRAAGLHLTVRLDAGALRLWHLRLVERLAERLGRGLNVALEPGGAGAANAERLFRLETLVHALPRPGLATPLAPEALSPFAGRGGAPADLVLDLCGAPRDGERPGGRAAWRLDFDGAPGEAGLLAAVFAGRTPVASVREGQRVVATARLGTEMQSVALGAFENYLARTITLVVASLDGAASCAIPGEATPPVSPPGSFDPGRASLGARAVEILGRKAARRLHDLVCYSSHWRIGWRKLDGPDLVDLRRHPDSGWTDLPDDGRRFYADPFPLVHGDGLTVFMEEFEHRQGKGIISAVDFGPEGPLGRPEPVLDLDCHLSYPFVFARDGAVWMIPETCGRGRIELYRATDFPRGWVREAVLIDGAVASDATLVERDGRWWMFATVQDGGCYSDALHVWSAPDFRGPWTPHPRNPVLIDVASARPAGHFVERGGALFRPVQDCRRGYGYALGLARVLRLDDDGFEQVVETTLGAGPRWRGRRMHTLNAAGGFEFIDGSGRAGGPPWRRS